MLSKNTHNTNKLIIIIIVIVLVRHIPVSPWPTCVADVSAGESDVDLVVVVVGGESVVTVVGTTVQTAKYVY